MVAQNNQGPKQSPAQEYADPDRIYGDAAKRYTAAHPFGEIISLSDPAPDPGGQAVAAHAQELARGIGTRDAGAMPGSAYGQVAHQQLYDWVQQVNPEQNVGVGEGYTTIANQLGPHAQELNAAVTSSRQHWSGAAADAAHGFMTGMAGWVDHAGQGSALAGNQLTQQAHAAEMAKTNMPKPSNFDMNAAVQGLLTDPNPFTMASRTDQIEAQARAATDGHEQAISTMNQYHGSLGQGARALPAYAPPPSVQQSPAPPPTPGQGSGGGSTPATPPGASADTSHGGDVGQGRAPAGGSAAVPPPTVRPPGAGGTPPSGGSDGGTPGAAGGGATRPSSGGGSGVTSPAAGPPIDATAPGLGAFSGPGAVTGGAGGGAPGGGMGSDTGWAAPLAGGEGVGPGLAGGGSSGGGPRGSGSWSGEPGGGQGGRAGAGGQPGTGERPGAGPRSGAGALGAEESAALRAGGTSATGRAGAGGMMPPPGGRGGKDEDEEHQTKFLVPEDGDDLFGTDEKTAPPVIGE